MGKLIYQAIARKSSAEFFYKRSKIDDNINVDLDCCCFDIQQSMEFFIKGFVEFFGTEYIHSHDLRANIKLIENIAITNETVSDHLNELKEIFNKIILKVDMYNSWETKTRYDESFIALVNEIEEAFKILNELEDFSKKLLKQ